MRVARSLQDVAVGRWAARGLDLFAGPSVLRALNPVVLMISFKDEQIYEPLTIDTLAGWRCRGHRCTLVRSVVGSANRNKGPPNVGGF